MTGIIYTLPSCPWCVKAKKLLDLKGVEYEEINEKFDGWPTVPYIEIDGRVIGGFTELARYLRSV
jgi:glutaredoxin 3